VEGAQVYRKETRIVNATGVHAQPAAKFVMTAQEFESEVTVQNLDREGFGPVNGKSLVHLLAAGLSRGTRIAIAAEGADEVAAVEALVTLVESGFGE